MNYHQSENAIGWFRDQYVAGTLIIKPPYQRKPVWKARQKCYLVESILKGLPIPELYVQQAVSGDQAVRYAIVDGQQRLRAILQFIGVERDVEEADHNRFSLEMLDATSPWHGFRYADLSEDEKRKFIGYRLSVRVLETDDDGEIREMFARLNKFLTPLKAQELRNSTYSGPFVRLVSRYADDEYWAENRIVTAESIRRMGDIEFVSELVIGLLHGPQGGGAATIDEYYAQYEDYEDEFPGQKGAMRLFEETLSSMREIMPKIKETRWGNKSDFYSLFVALGALLKKQVLPKKKRKGLKDALDDFADDVDLLREKENAKVSDGVRKYLDAVERGANEKSRRADRHEVLITMMSDFLG
jgi:hypothetical protein